mmetsp:Transcript_114500/g.160753  ORF Transcript_114500/g.160753 Transcript_114500/m.160753 type:complete len:190 (-) Transcript_114500:156-725(-)
MDNIILFISKNRDIGTYVQNDMGPVRREDLVIFDIYEFLAAFRIFVGKNLKWNSVWKRIKRAGFELEAESRPKSSPRRHYFALVPQTGLVEMATLASEIRDEFKEFFSNRRGHKRPRGELRENRQILDDLTARDDVEVVYESPTSSPRPDKRRAMLLQDGQSSNFSLVDEANIRRGSVDLSTWLCQMKK